MRMPVMQVRIMRVLVRHRRMVMPVCVRLTSKIASRMHMLMMIVVPVPVLMLDSGMLVLVLVALGHMQIDAGAH